MAPVLISGMALADQQETALQSAQSFLA